jgi:L-asparaginase
MSITLIATGGTIASTRGDDGAVTATLSGQDLLDRVLGDAGLGGADVEVVDLSVPGSWNLSTELAATVAGVARDALQRGADGVVVTHGTDVLEETAWLTELLVERTCGRGSVVFTAAMRHGGEFGGDGPRNLADALQVAADPATVARGALVCVNGELHHARWVTKTHTTALCTFASPVGGPVGAVDEQRVRFSSPSPPATPGVRRDAAGNVVLGGAVPVLVSHWEVDPGLVDWHLERGVAGLVVEGGGAGNVNGGMVDGLLAALAAGVPVVVTSRCRGGEVQPIYGGRGGFATLAEAGALASYGLGSGKARLALQVALGVDPDPHAVRAWFDGLRLS